MEHDGFMVKLGAWSGLLYLLLFGTGWLVIARFMPPVDPTATATAVADLYASRHVLFVLAAVMMMVSTVILLPLSGVLILLVHRIERGIGMTTLMIAFTVITFMVLNFYTGLSFAAAAFRPARDAGLVQLANDMGFLQFIGGTPMFLGTWILLAYAILVLQRRTGAEVFPRWVGYGNLLVAILYLPEVLIYFFHDGPFAWNGLVGFWIPAFLLIGYLLITPFVLVPAVKKVLL